MTRAKALTAALLLSLSCAPQYESGKTACASSGQACPDGYTCINIRCYKLGEAPDGSSAAGGSGGGGSGGATDARVTGTGGSGGAGGAGGGSLDMGQPAVCNDPMRPKRCPANGNIPAGCVSNIIDCSTAKMCGPNDIRACATGRMVNCAYRLYTCVGPTLTCDDPMFPDPCPGLGEVGPACYTTGVDCTTITICGNEDRPTACGVGAKPDCTRPVGMRCVRPSPPDGAAPDAGSADASADGRG